MMDEVLEVVSNGDVLRSQRKPKINPRLTVQGKRLSPHTKNVPTTQETMLSEKQCVSKHGKKVIKASCSKKMKTPMFEGTTG